MPHKTHKTAHVLNLLSVGTGKEETTQQAEQTEQIEKKENVTNIQIIDNPKDPSDPLAGLIKDSLEKEVLGDMSDTSESSTLEFEDFEDEIPEDVETLSASDLSPSTSEVPVVDHTQVNIEEHSKPQVQPTAPQPVEQSIQPPQLPEPDYCYVNIMDVLIDKRLEEFMKKFDTCTCDRCKKDVRALAMSNLPPKYIVMPNASYAPLVSFYANKYQFNIITELTKACLAVISNPRHE